MTRPSPVFILGVPRSGTTLLRTLLDSHPNIACGPEAPWIAGSYGGAVSFKEMMATLVSDKHGPVANFSGVESRDVAEALGLAVTEIFFRYARKKGKKRWVEKTPNHVMDIELLNILFPGALYLHIVRDGRDVACSTYNGRKNWGMILDVDGSLEITRMNSLDRWARWEKMISDARDKFDLAMYTIRYEDIIAAPEEKLRKILAFMGEGYVETMLRYSDADHDYPSWEVGSSDVRNKGELTGSSIGRWKKEYPSKELSGMSILALETLSRHGYAIDRMEGEKK